MKKNINSIITITISILAMVSLSASKPEAEQKYNVASMTEVHVTSKGKHCNGTVGCDCPGFSPISHKEVYKQSYCKHCGHHRKCHK